MSVNPTPVDEAQSSATNDKEHNLGILRKQIEQERLSKMEMERKIEMLSQEVEEARRIREEASDPVDDNEPYIDHKLLDKKLSALKKEFVKDIDKRAEEKARAILNEERRTNYLDANRDYNDTMSMDNLRKFSEKYPDVARCILHMPEGFERDRLVYENMKALGITRKEEAKPPIQQTIDNNRKNIFYQPGTVGAPPFAMQGDFSPTGQKAAYAKIKELKARIGIHE
jgi:hypothetical protein